MIPKHLRPKIKINLGVSVHGVKQRMWECSLDHETAVSYSPSAAYRLLVYGFNNWTTIDRLKKFGLS